MKSFLLIALLFFTLDTIAQTTISGHLKDTKGKPIIAASISIKDSYDGTVSDSSGNFSFITTEAGNHIITITQNDFGDYEATVDLNSRIVTTTEIKKVNPAVGKYTLAETKWKLVWLNKKKQIVQNGNKVYFLKLNSKDARFTAFAGCNSIAGNYIMPSSETIDFSDVIMTQMACADMTLEDIFGAMLVQARTFKLEKNTLTFFGDGKKVLSKFEAIQ